MKAGVRVAGYEILEKLGAGGMGEVYKARNVMSGRVEAIKVLLPSLEGSGDLPIRFEREIKVQAALDHPNIARLYTAQLVDGELLMVMEYVEGMSLQARLAQGVLASAEAIGYAVQILDALAYAHSRGVTHRDVKPANIMLMSTGTIKLMDFGIARMNADDRITRTGCGVGSLPYMSPEQIQGGAPDPRSDVYSFGACLYEMLSGRPPFEGDGALAVMAAHLGRLPRALVEIVPGIAKSLSDAVFKALAKDPAERFQTAAEFRAALQPGETIATVTFPGGGLCVGSSPAADSGAPSGAAADRGSGRRGLYMALGSVATLLVLAVGVVEGPRLMRAGRSGASAVGVGDAAAPSAGSARSPGAPSSPGRPLASLGGSVAPSVGVGAPARSVGRAPVPGVLGRPRGGALAVGGGGPGALLRSGGGRSPAAGAADVPVDLRDRLDVLRARLAAYAAALDAMSTQLKGQGVALRPELSLALHVARTRLEAAEVEINHRAFIEARASMDTADAALQHLGKIYGR